MTKRRAIDVPGGAAWLDIDVPRSPAALLALGHGAGGGVDAPDLLAVRDAAIDNGIAVVRITQPYRVAGRRAPAPAARLDEAWLAALTATRADRRLRDLPFFSGGRSSGARVACRTARTAGASAVIALAFPVHPPGRPERSRLDELDAVTVPVLVVQGDRDAFGMPPRGKGRRVVTITGADHSLRQDTAHVATAVIEFVTRQVGRATVGT